MNNEVCYICGTPYTGGPHHLLDRSQFPQFKNADWNMVVLCPECHRRVTLNRARKVKLRQALLPERIKNQIDNHYLERR